MTTVVRLEEIMNVMEDETATATVMTAMTCTTAMTGDYDDGNAIIITTGCIDDYYDEPHWLLR